MGDISNKELLELISAQFSKINTDLDSMSAQYNKANNDIEFIAAQVSKLTSDLSDFKKETSENFIGVNERLDDIDKRVIVIENVHGARLDAIFDGYTQLNEGQREIKDDINRLYEHQENQDIEIRVLKSTSK